MSFRVGDRVGRWKIVAGPRKEVRVTEGSTNYLTVFDCVCECGASRAVRAAKLARNSRSCGCLKRDALRGKRRHGHCARDNRSRLYGVWSGMLQRTTNPNHRNFHLYGGKGIKVCDEWRDFDAFRRWAESEGFGAGLQIDRIDSRKNYEPSNCRWVSTFTQSRNKSSVHKISAFGETRCAADWAADNRCHVAAQTIVRRIMVLGWPAETAITAERRARFHPR